MRKSVPVGQNAQAVLAFLKRCRQSGETREDLFLQVTRCFGRGRYFARKIVTRERTWTKQRVIAEGKKGCYTKTRSWLDNGVQLAVREWLAGTKDSELH